MEQRYIDSLTEICGKANVFMKWQILSGIYMMRQKNMFDQKHVRIVLLSVREHMKKYLKFLNGQIELVPVIPRGGGTVCLRCSYSDRAICYHEYGAFQKDR